jgi:hypothetical protein
LSFERNVSKTLIIDTIFKKYLIFLSRSIKYDYLRKKMAKFFLLCRNTNYEARCQFHQRYTCLFRTKFRRKKLQSFVLALRLFGAKILYHKRTHKTLMKLAAAVEKNLQIRPSRPKSCHPCHIKFKTL